MNDHLQEIHDAIVKGAHKEIEDRVEKALAARMDPDTIINDAMIDAMDVVGIKFSHHEIFVPEMLVSALTMNKGLDILKPLLQQAGARSKGKVMMCTVKGDVHDIGKNLVIMMLEGAGFEVINLGVDLNVEKVIEQVKEHQPDILGLSALLTTTMPEMQRVIESLVENGLRDRLKVMVGGAPLDTAFADRIGADGYGKDAAAAVQLARRLMP